MKTKWIAPKKNSLVPFIMAAVFGLASFSCTESWDFDDTGDFRSGINTEEFWVDREGKVVYALEGAIILEFPEEAVIEPTLFTLEMFPLNPLEMSGCNMMNCGISLESAAHELKFAKSVLIKLNYCLSDFKAGNPVDEENLTLYRIVPEVFAYSIGECTVDCTWKLVSGCINECGFYVVGEN